MVVHGWIQTQVSLVCTTQYKGRKLGESTHTVPDFLLLLEDLMAIAWHSAAELSLNLATVPTTPYCLPNTEGECQSRLSPWTISIKCENKQK